MIELTTTPTRALFADTPPVEKNVCVLFIEGVSVLAVGLARAGVSPMSELVRRILFMGSMREILDGVVGWVAVNVAHHLGFIGGVEERGRHKDMNPEGLATSLPVVKLHIPVSITGDTLPEFDPFANELTPPVTASSVDGTDQSVVADFIAWMSGDCAPLLGKCLHARHLELGGCNR